MSKLEAPIMHEVREALGGLPDLVLWRIVPTGPPDSMTGRVFRCAPKGWPDLCGILKPSGRFVCIETKREKGGRLSEEQCLHRDLVRALGGFWSEARSACEALAAIDRARNGLTG